MTLNAIQPRLNDVIAGRQALALDILDDDGQVCGVLRPLTRADLDDAEIIRKLTEWRNQNMANFLSHFVATPERTLRWMSEMLFKTPGQLLFLVCADGQVVGHFGFKDLSRDEVLLDNAMRGERQGHPKLFVYAGRRLVAWLLQEAAVRRVHAYVMTENVASVMMNKQIGFAGWIRHPLIKRVKDGETRWEMGEPGESSPDERYCFRLVIEQPES